MSLDEETRRVVPGDAIWIPTGSTHGLANTGHKDCVILIIASPAW